jgi:hypothetical protein
VKPLLPPFTFSEVSVNASGVTGGGVMGVVFFLQEKGCISKMKKNKYKRLIFLYMF